MNTVKVELVKAAALTRYCCDLGGTTDKESILCEVTEGPHAGFRVSPAYLRTHNNVDADLNLAADAAELRAQELFSYAVRLRSLKGRLVLPSYEDWQRASIAHDIERTTAEIAGRRTMLAELEQMRAEGAPVSEDISSAEADIHELVTDLAYLNQKLNGGAEERAATHVKPWLEEAA